MNLRASLLLASSLLLLPLSLSAAAPQLFGDWTTSDGSVVRTYPCSNALCIKLVAITPTAPGSVDHNNPDAALRTRSLCNLEIGSGFALTGDSEANGGRLYDPESGKTYKGNLALKGDTLKLRGYIGVALFGRTETWRHAANLKPCGN